MLSLLQFFLQLCLLRTRPQDLPASQALLVLVALANIVVGTIVATPALGDPATALQASLLDTVLMAGFAGLLLKFRNHPARFLQTATALLGVSTVMMILSLVLRWVLPEDAAGEASQAGAESLVFLGILVWLQLALGHVLRHALDTSLALGIGLAFLYSIISSVVIQAFFLVPAGS